LLARTVCRLIVHAERPPRACVDWATLEQPALLSFCEREGHQQPSSPADMVLTRKGHDGGPGMRIRHPHRLAQGLLFCCFCLPLARVGLSRSQLGRAGPGRPGWSLEELWACRHCHWLGEVLFLPEKARRIVVATLAIAHPTILGRIVPPAGRQLPLVLSPSSSRARYPRRDLLLTCLHFTLFVHIRCRIVILETRNKTPSR